MIDRDDVGDSRLRVGRWLPSPGGSAPGRPPEPAGPPTAGDPADAVIELAEHDLAPAEMPDRAESLSRESANDDPERPATSLLRPVQVDRGRFGRRGRWWFVVVPAAVIILVIAVAVQFRTGRPAVEPTLPQMTPQVALPELGSAATPTPGQSSGSVSAKASRSASRSAGTSAAPPAGGAGVADLPAPPPTTGAPAPQRGSFISVGGHCLEPVGLGANSYIQLAVCAPVDRQRWAGPGDGTLRTIGNCLDVFASGESNGTPVVLYECNGTDAQQWQIRGDRTWRNPQSNRCLSTVNGSTALGARLTIWDCTAAPAQQFVLA